MIVSGTPPPSRSCEVLARRKLAPRIFGTEAEALDQMQQRSMSKP